jgi:hypothetical protein
MSGRAIRWVAMTRRRVPPKPQAQTFFAVQARCGPGRTAQTHSGSRSRARAPRLLGRSAIRDDAVHHSNHLLAGDPLAYFHRQGLAGVVVEHGQGSDATPVK